MNSMEMCVIIRGTQKTVKFVPSYFNLCDFCSCLGHMWQKVK